MNLEKYFPENLLTVLQDLLGWLEKIKGRGLVIGGVAAAFLGRPRTTQDLDAVIFIDEDQLVQMMEIAKEFRLIPRISDVLKFARRTRVLLMHHQSGVDVDLSLGALPFELEALERTQWVQMENVRIPIPTPEDLVIMKAVAHRPKDAVDIESMLDAFPNLDLQRVRQWVAEFARVMEMPEILEDLENILKRHQSL